VDPSEFAAQDPFILLADDRLDLPPDSTAGAEHPHAGFETVTFVLEGALHDQDEGVLAAGDVQWMTAGRGIIHGEHVVPQGRTRILQLWVALSESERWSEPRFETITLDAAPARRGPGFEARVYSGASGSIRAPAANHVAMTLVDVRLDPGATLEQDLPASYNAFIYVLDGVARVGDNDSATLGVGQVGWLDRAEASGPSVLRITGGDEGARLVLYAGEPHDAPIVMHGPFVGGTRSDIVRVSREYTAGRFQRMSALVRARPAANVG
jgi:redox-sensitive bicupin YhaK (pirin superfamily)